MKISDIFDKGTDILKKISSFLKKEEQKSDDDKFLDTRPCKRPFEYFSIENNGDVYPCCKEFLKYGTSAGNIEKHDFQEIWNGKMLTDLRKRMINSDFSMCDREGGCIYEPYHDGTVPSGYEKGPKEIKIGYDYECNYNCITCRDMVKINMSDELEKYNEVYLPKIIEIAKNTECVGLLMGGEPLFSRHSKHLIQELIKAYPDIEFNLFTNGVFLTEENLKSLGIQNNIRGLSVSVDAATRETYKIIHRADEFDNVVKNLELMAEWKNKGKINWITINFVVHLLNYKEMPAFAELAQKLGVVAFFSTYRPWVSAEYNLKYETAAVFERDNKHYDDFVNMLKNSVFKDKNHCILEPCIFEIVYADLLYN